MSRQRLFPAAVTALIVALIAMPGSLSAQRGTPPGRVDLTLSTASIAFTTPTTADFDAGFIDHPGMLVSVVIRPQGRPWELRLRADDPSLGGYGKPLGDLLWRVDGSTVWTPITGTDQAVTQGAGDQDVTVYFRLRLGWAVDSPSAYGTALTFSIFAL